MTKEQFQARVNDALAMIPERFRDALQNIVIVIEGEPTLEQLDSVGLAPPETLLGLYQGTPLTERHWDYGNALPDKVTLFQRIIEESSDDDEDVTIAVAETLIHEIGHYFGLSEEEIEEIEDHYWHGDADDDGDGDDADDEDEPG